MADKSIWLARRKRVSEIIEVGYDQDWPSRIYDLVNALAIFVNLAASILYTFEELRGQYGALLLTVESITVVFFTVDYCLRLWTARALYTSRSEVKAALKYALSFSGLVDLFSFLPYYLPVFFPEGAVAFRMFRVVRIFRLFRINAYYDSLNVITQVIASKRQQLLSSVFIILTLMLASSLCMYSLEHEAQPDVFINAFSGIWWSMSTLLTVGYGDIYPITTLGKLFGIGIAFLGVGMVAIPTGIISAGFVDQYSRIKRLSEYANETDIHFIKVTLLKNDPWAGRTIAELGLPAGIIVAAIHREGKIIVPRGNVELHPEDTLVLGAKSLGNDKHIDLKEMVLRSQNPWNGQRIRDLDISRQTIIVMVRRRGNVLIPNGDLVLREGDSIILYTQSHIRDASTIEI
ncbi:ion transporter [Flintibacter muris]|uniref:ion transporter n=1 Tax=Flintibacter muris TaxID=2941327 RepID=UPI002041D01A|nr:ion transporter [Flintibacter muris]